ncbi:MAG: hypothetical protein ACYTEP_09265 [Planctomycetota bacterium]|jgi:hypothetical protein
MTTPQRLGLLLIGLLVLAGALHAPLHEEGHDCGPMALCGGGVVLMVAALVVGLLLVSGPIAQRRPAEIRIPRGPPRARARGRAPPR